MFEKVLIAIDGSQHAGVSLEAGEELVRLSGGEARVVHVRDVMVFPRGGEIADEERSEAEELVEGAVSRLNSRGTKATGVARASINGHVAREILAEADEWGATVLVMASRGLGEIAGMMLGSTTHKVLHLGHLPVLVVR